MVLITGWQTWPLSACINIIANISLTYRVFMVFNFSQPNESCTAVLLAPRMNNLTKNYVNKLCKSLLKSLLQHFPLFLQSNVWHHKDYYGARCQLANCNLSFWLRNFCTWMSLNIFLLWATGILWHLTSAYKNWGTSFWYKGYYIGLSNSQHQ